MADDESAARLSKRHHKKSHGGCSQCKRRKVKVWLTILFVISLSRISVQKKEADVVERLSRGEQGSKRERDFSKLLTRRLSSLLCTN
jgi:hypothetical protein